MNSLWQKQLTIGDSKDESVIDFGLAIDDKYVVNDILLSLIGAETINNPSIADTLPKANIRIDDTKMGVCYLWLKVWVNGDDVIFLSREDESESSSYKKINGDSAKMIVEYISKYK